MWRFLITSKGYWTHLSTWVPNLSPHQTNIWFQLTVLQFLLTNKRLAFYHVWSGSWYFDLGKGPFWLEGTTVLTVIIFTYTRYPSQCKTYLLVSRENRPCFLWRGPEVWWVMMTNVYRHKCLLLGHSCKCTWIENNQTAAYCHSSHCFLQW